MDNHDSIFTAEEQAELDFSQRLRMSLIRDLAPEGKAPAKGQVFLLGLLDGADRSALSRAKMRADKKRDEDMRDTVKLVGEAMKNINAKTYRPIASKTEREIPAALEHRTFVPGELDIGNEPVVLTQVMDN